MKGLTAFLDRLAQWWLNERVKHRVEVLIIYGAVLSFFLHLALIALGAMGWIAFDNSAELLRNPIAAIYTPFSFILVYEVFLLVYYLPSSITTYLAKQYEIITLIVIRRLFKDLAALQFTPNWFQNQNDLQFTLDLVTTLVLFLLILGLYRLRAKGSGSLPPRPDDGAVGQLVRLKTRLAVLLLPLLFGLALYSFGHWLGENLASWSRIVANMKDVNSIFFDEFFTLLILADVLLLLFSFLHTPDFHVVMRNSGFIISTILIRMSFGVDGWLNSVLIVMGVGFGVAILAIFNQYEKLQPRREMPETRQELV